MEKLISKYARFHGHAPRYARNVKFNVPEGFVRLGDAVAIEYQCDKLNGGGDGKTAVYRHVFSRGAMLLMDKSAKRQLYIVGKNIRVTTAGIEG